MPPFGPGAGSAPLDGPPPSPQATGAGPTGGAPFSLDAMAPPPTVPTNQMPPEILTGILASSEKIGQLLDSYAQVAPDLALKFNAIKNQLQAVLAELAVAGAGATSPTNPGAQFPAAFDRGIAGPGTV